MADEPTIIGANELILNAESMEKLVELFLKKSLQADVGVIGIEHKNESGQQKFHITFVVGKQSKKQSLDDVEEPMDDDDEDEEIEDEEDEEDEEDDWGT